MRTSRDFEELFACLRRHGVKALVVGAHAVAFHAKPRHTKDIDILVAREGRVVQLGYPPSRVDLITAQAMIGPSNPHPSHAGGAGA